ncbi:DUF2867 domain-containing protein [Phreatobacter aquaticus]|uniref:DUF2867 domain-containing protein n=1 Tax=Phreatobacter aquaticus TaxID=2570229 RepID=A0A4D7QW95_9HYPH|nr:DUF2867 domain-containing protein [Phreatobacter aquaticus]QCK88222.1 DUF2867 domain-containing protein [Phreatobacter aquaticus]
MQARAVTPDIDPGSLLAGAGFIDAFRIVVTDSAIDAPTAAERMMGRSPRWVTALLKLRNVIVRPLGLKGPVEQALPSTERIGIFPVISRSPERVVVGLDDRHLDFRAVIDVTILGNSRQITASTIVKTHNWLGRTYLATIMPFHRVIVRTMLEQVKAP